LADKIRIGIVGAAANGNSWGARAHIPALKTLLEYELKAICTTREETAKASQAAFGTELAFHDYTEMANHPEIDLVAVCVRVPFHHEIAMAALRAGKHTYCEWPLGANLREAQEMADLARKQGVRNMVGLQSRADPGMTYIKELVEGGHVGQVLAANMTLFSAGILERPSGRMWQREKIKGANTLTILAGHAIDGMNYALGDFLEVSGKVATTVHEWRATNTGEVAPVDSPDNVIMGGVLESGALASLHVAAVPFGGSGWRLEIFGRGGTLYASTGGMPQMTEVHVMAQKGSAAPVDMPVPQRLTIVPEDTPKGPPHNIGQLYARLAPAIADGKDAEPGFDHAVRLHKLLDAMQKASDEGRTVRLA
jgi:predicted dehydrogenase